MEKYYFFRTVRDGSRERLRPLAGQTAHDGSVINPNFNTKGSKRMRESYPIGTVFCSKVCEQQGGYYAAGDLFPMDINLGDYLSGSHMPTPDMVRAFREFKEREEAPADLFSAAGMPIGDTAATPEEPEMPKAFSMLEMLSSDRRYVTPTVDSDGFSISDDNWRLLLRNILTGTNTMMIGPTGTGKTELVMLACRKLGIECNVYNMGTIFDPISELLGVHRLVGGSSTFDYAKFAKDVQKPGVILLDELSRAPVTTNNVLFPCLDSRRVLPVDMAGGDDLRVIPLHPKCVFVATANVGSEYTGTMSMDRALVGRFFPLELGYMESEEEKKVLVKRHGISESDARNIVTVAATVRSKHAATELSSSLSTRETLMAARLISDGWSAQKAMELTFLPLFEGTKVEGERAVVMQIILSR